MPRAQRLQMRSIDEVSSVDRGASAPALIAIAKRDTGEDDGMQFFDSEGNPIPESELVSGTLLFDEGGEPITNDDGMQLAYYDDDDYEQMVASGEIEPLPDDASSLIDDDDRELVGIGKAAGSAITGGLHTTDRVSRGRASGLGQGGTGRGPSRGRGRGRGRGRALPAGGSGGGAGMVNKRSNVSKSAGQKFLETVSKAYSDADRDEVIAQALDTLTAAVQDARADARQATTVSKSLEDQAILRQYIELADDYGLPVESEEFGEILAQIAESGMSKSQLETLDRVFSAAGDAAGLLDEQGVTGYGSASDVMAQVHGAVQDRVSKAADNGLTTEQAVTDVFATNPGAYEAYLAERGER